MGIIDDDSNRFVRFAEALIDAANLLDDLPSETRGQETESLPSLLEQCSRLRDEARLVSEQPIRMIHHFGCTGGTLISKCVASMPNVHLLSEVDPLSELGYGKTRFRPTDLIGLLKCGTREPAQDLIIEVFRSGLRAVYEDSVRKGQYLVLRDHAHSHFCASAQPSARPTVREIVAAVFPVRSVVTVRHPMDSWLSLLENKWIHFEPVSVSEYSKRYMDFLERHRDCEVVRYEDFVRDPDGSMRVVANVLDLPFNDSFLDLFHAQQLSGDSGRKSADVSTRPRRPMSIELEQELLESAAFLALCDRLGYRDPIPERDPNPEPS